MALAILVLVYFFWARKISPALGPKNSTEQSPEGDLKLDGVGNAEIIFEDHKLIAADVYKMFLPKDQVTIIVDDK
jgi:hypothetical protein